MSYQMTHLEIAYRLLDKYKWIKVRPDFLLGAIAPDAVHFHEEYHVEWKEQSHLWDCGPRWGITLDSDKWKRNVLDFWDTHKTDPNRDYIAGYCLHILTDCVLQKDVETQKRHMLSKQYKNMGNCDISGHRYCTEAVTISFIDECVEELKDILGV